VPAPDDLLLRHGPGVRLVHAIDALAVLVLSVTGLAVSGDLPPAWSGWLGGHERLNATHQLLGIWFVGIALLWSLARLPVTWRFLRRIFRFGRDDARWLPRYVLHLATPLRHAPPRCDGYFDPGQRLAFIGILATMLLAGASGTYLYAWSPQMPGAAWIGPMIRLHIASTWLLMALLTVHILAGSGLLWTHRGLARTMFGDGRVTPALAERLWPDWASTRQEQQRRDGSRR